MKYLLILGLVLVVFWWLRNNRRDGQEGPAAQAPARQPGPSGLPTEIVACGICEVHLPRAEALAGPHGLYCCEAHRQKALSA